MPPDLLPRLHAILGPGGASNAKADLRLHASDALRPSRAFPGAESLSPMPHYVAWPATAGEVQALVRLANDTATPLVPYGGGTGLMGGAIPVRGGIVVDLARLSRIRTVDPEARTITVEAGAILRTVGKALEPHGLILGHDPWTVPIATVGGTISTNSLGYRGAVYGSMGDQVLGLEAVLPDGTLLQTRAVPKHSAGPSLHQLFVGGEGCFGIITAATLKAFPAPERRALYAFRFESFEPGFRAVQRMFGAGLVPAMIDYGEDFETPVPRGWGRGPLEPGAEMYLAFEGMEGIVRAQEERALAYCLEEGAQRLPDEDAWDFWNSRHRAAERFVRQRTETGLAPYLQQNGGPAVDYMHVALPASKVLDCRARAWEIAAANGVQVREFGLWNRPELFSIVLVEAMGDTSRLARAVDQVLMYVQDLGGSIEYVHGIGLRLAHLMDRELGAGITLLRQIKRQIDPNNIMNPGKLAL